VLLLLGLLVVARAYHSQGDFADRGTLWVGQERRGEQLAVRGHHHPPVMGASYLIGGLQSGASYEVRLSYPATNPVEFNVWFTTSEEGLHRRGTTRSLLNVAQHRFTVPQVATREPRGAAVLLPEDRSDRVDEEQQLVMLVSAVREGVPAPGMSDDGIVRYNIVVEQLTSLGGVPIRSWNVAVLLVFMTALAVLGATTLRQLLLKNSRISKSIMK